MPDSHRGSDPHRGTDPVGVALATLPTIAGLQVLDVGGGSGTDAVPLAVKGCVVTVVDPSMDALATLRRRASEAGVADRVLGIQADTDAMAGAVVDGSVGLVLCHHVLESVDDPRAAMAAIAAALAPGGTVSLLVTGRYAAVIALGISGRFTEAAAVHADPAGTFGSADPLRRRFDVDSIGELLAGSGLSISAVRGVGVVSGLVPSAVLQPSSRGADELAVLERQIADDPPLRDIAADLHVLAVRDS
ncbi:class I SAM-dependent methyltransferase [Nakamurella lactea]|uniref:class I SAM-dependent methyltransferase n=1 Tax=Nakamurella lactea TaxID=459515 RepID=UPI0003F70BDA|nr:methyltransferase domain-containing protein [Nakamurella lactea]